MTAPSRTDNCSVSFTAWQVFSALIVDQGALDQDAEVARANGCLEVLAQNLGPTRQAVDTSEAEILGLAYGYWWDHSTPASLAMLNRRLAPESNPVLEERLKEFEEIASDLASQGSITVREFPVLLKALFEEKRQERLVRILDQTKLVAVCGGKVKSLKTGEKQFVKGTDDALKFMRERLVSRQVVVQETQTSGLLHESTHVFDETLEDNHNPEVQRRRRIFTGIDSFDQKIFMTKGQFVGILGYAGHGKTTCGRTMVYNAAYAGKNCLHLTLEQDFNEEVNRYIVAHASNQEYWGDHASRLDVSLQAFTRGQLSREAQRYLKEVSKDLKERKSIPGLFIDQPLEPTWDAIRQKIDEVDRELRLDMVFIDYLAMVQVPDRSRVDYINGIITESKNLAMTYRGGEGLLVVTPVQANRAGLEAARKEEGRWDISAAHTFSNFERDLDTCLTVYSDDNLSNVNKVRLGTCKHRRGPDVPPFDVNIDRDCGLIRDRRLHAELTLDDVMDDL